MTIIYVANLAAVGIFGIILSALFCDIKWTRKKYIIYILASAAILLLQGIVFKEWDLQTVYCFYPLITHLPVAMFAGDGMVQNIMELIITVPLFLFLVKFIAPSVRAVVQRAGKRVECLSAAKRKRNARHNRSYRV